MSNHYKKPLLMLFLFIAGIANSAIGQVFGPATICTGSTASFSTSSSGGTWTSSTPSVASIDSTSGVAYGLVAGITTITYNSASPVTKTVTVMPSPSAIGGPSTICAGSSITLTNATAGGSWSCAVTVVAVAGSSSGVVWGMSAGTATVSYTLATGCSATRVVTVLPTPVISGPWKICQGTGIALSSTGGTGTWSSSASHIATVSGTGAAGSVYGTAVGTATISYTTATCTGTYFVQVFPKPASITGPSGTCPGNTATLMCVTSGGTWSTSTPAIGSIDPTTGAAGGLTTGAMSVSYTLSSGCSSTAVFTVFSAPPSITGPATTCVSGSSTLANSVSGGVWTSGSPGVATIGAGSGSVSGIASGTTIITYSLGSGCATTTVHSVVSGAGPITGASSLCTMSSVVLSDPTPGGTWTSSNTTVAAIGTLAGQIYGVSGGTATITHSVGGSCFATHIVTIVPGPASISGPTSTCLGSGATYTCATSGGTWSSATPATGTIDAATGAFTTIATGSTILSYTIATGCASLLMVNVTATPTVTAAATKPCGSSYVLTATGGITYSWSPASGLSCTTCSVTTVNPTSTTTYTVTGSISGCASTSTVTVNGNRIHGHITFSGYTPDTLDMKVWLVEYDPTDSSITALDSMISCYVDSVAYYEFTGKAPGSYMVKAKEVYGNLPGTSGYIPTYGTMSSVWSSATNVTHGSGSDSIHITMIYGTVPAGPGFIGGNVYSGAGKRTADVLFPGMLLYLKDAASGNIITYAYSDATGAYAFSGIALGSYIVVAEEYKYNSTPSSVITLTSSAPSASAVHFKRYVDPTFQILPFALPTVARQVAGEHGFNIAPNPATDHFDVQWKGQQSSTCYVTMRDMMGRCIYQTTLKIDREAGTQRIQLPSVSNGLYFISVKSETINFSSRITIQR